MPKKMIEYTSEDGYTGQLYGKSNYRIIDRYGKEVFSTAYTNIRTYEELKADVDGFPEFAEMMRKKFAH
jgi:hypothetical protein